VLEPTFQQTGLFLIPTVPDALNSLSQRDE
jgi:hypothetical protein